MCQFTFNCHNSKGERVIISIFNDHLTIQGQFPQKLIQFKDACLSFQQDKKQKISGLTINKETFICQQDDLLEFKRHIGKKVVFNNLYSLFYKIIKSLGSGTYAQVYLVEDVRNNKQFAMKVTTIIPSQEISILQKISHENIAETYEFYKCNSQIYIIMENVDSIIKLEDLEHDDIKSLIQVFFLYIQLFLTFPYQQILIGLQYLHSLNIIHRDIKLDNIMISKMKNIKIIDFGLATLEQSQDNRVCGTPGYMGPEILNKQPYSNKCDLFSVGVIMYRLYTKQKLFQSDDFGELIFMNKSFSPNQLKILKISDRGYELLYNLLNQDPNRRYSAQEALEHYYFTCTDEPVIQYTGFRIKPNLKDIKKRNRQSSSAYNRETKSTIDISYYEIHIVLDIIFLRWGSAYKSQLQGYLVIISNNEGLAQGQSVGFQVQGSRVQFAQSSIFLFFYQYYNYFQQIKNFIIIMNTIFMAQYISLVMNIQSTLRK